MAQVWGVDHKYWAIGAITLSTGVTAVSLYKYFSERRRRKSTDNVYETTKLVNEYLVFHYGRSEEILNPKYESGPSEAIDFPKRCAKICLQHYKKKSGIPNRALDIGCAVGRTSFELAQGFDEVIGIDFSQAFIDTCNHLKEEGHMNYCVTDEGDLVTNLVAKVDENLDRSRCHFQQGDACNLPIDLGQFGCVFAGNLVDRLPIPMDFINRCPSLVASGGLLVLTSPYTWLEQFTPKNNWLGGYVDKNGKKVTTFDTLKAVLSPHFDSVEQREEPFFIRETARKNQWTVAHATIWRRK